MALKLDIDIHLIDKYSVSQIVNEMIDLYYYVRSNHIDCVILQTPATERGLLHL